MTHAPARCLDCLVRDTALCGSLNDMELASLSTIGKRRMLPPGQVISWAGDDNMVCANVVSGSLKMVASLPDGREQIVGILFPGDFVGEPFSSEAALTVSALTETDLCCFPRESFEHVLDDHPRVERTLLRRTLSSLHSARDRMLGLARMDARERIAGFLIDLMHGTGARPAGQPIRITVPMGRGEVADYLGLTIETVSRQFSRLKADGIITFDKGGRDLDILLPDHLAAIAQVD